MSGPRTRCSNCDFKLATRAGRCEACYRYLRRTGAERPLQLVGRRFELELAKLANRFAETTSM